jgi:hypothetical protein
MSGLVSFDFNGCTQAGRLTVIREGPSVLELLSGKDQSLLIGRNTLLVLNLGLDVVDGVRGLYLEGDGLSGKARRVSGGSQAHRSGSLRLDLCFVSVHQSRVGD